MSNPGAARHIMIIDRDARTVEPLRGRLVEAGYEVTMVDSSVGALVAAERHAPHLVMLDWDMPGIMSRRLMRNLRRSRDSLPRLIALSQQKGEDQIVQSLELGLDDYVVKPFSVHEVIARVRAVLRSLRVGSADEDLLCCGRIELDAARVEASVEGVPICLRTLEFRLLEFFMRHPNRVFGREYIRERVWGNESAVGIRAVNITVQRLRCALALHGCDGQLQAARGVGYRLIG